jgi:hypothetical protein
VEGTLSKQAETWGDEQKLKFRSAWLNAAEKFDQASGTGTRSAWTTDNFFARLEFRETEPACGQHCRATCCQLFFVIQRLAVGADLHFRLFPVADDFGFVRDELAFFG